MHPGLMVLAFLHVGQPGDPLCSLPLSPPHSLFLYISHIIRLTGAGGDRWFHSDAGTAGPAASPAGGPLGNRYTVQAQTTERFWLYKF